MAKLIQGQLSMFDLMMSKDLPKSTFSQELVDGLMQPDLQDGQTTDRSGQEVAPANHLALPVTKKVRRTKGIFGPSSSILSEPVGPMSSWENKLRQQLANLGSMECSLIWKESVTGGGATVVPACAVNAPHRRDRLWFVADTNSIRQWPRDGHEQSTRDTTGQRTSNSGSLVNVADAIVEGREGWLPRGQDQERQTVERHVGCNSPTHWSGAEWIQGADGKQRRFEPGICLLAHGVPARVGKLRAYGNAIVPQVAAEIIKAYMED